MLRCILLAVLIGVLLTVPCTAVQATTLSFSLSVPAVRHIVVDDRSSIIGVWDNFSTYSGPITVIAQQGSIEGQIVSVNEKIWAQYGDIVPKMSDTIGWAYRANQRSDETLDIPDRALFRSSDGAWQEITTIT